MPQNTRFYESNLKYGRERSFKKHLEDKMITEGDGRLIREYIGELSAGRHISELRANKIAFTLIRWRGYIDKEYQMVGIDDVYNGIAKLKGGSNNNGKPFKQNTLHDYVVILKPFLLWLIDNKYTNLPEKKVRAIKPPSMDYNVTLPEDLPTEAEIVAMIKGCKSVMERAFVAVLYESGARIGECARLTWGDVTFDKYGAKLYIDDHKTRKRRYSRLTMSVEYLATHRNNCPAADKQDFIFTSQNGMPLTYVTATRIIGRAVKDSGIQKEVTPHDLRRARTTHMIRQNIQESVIKKSLWGNVNTQQFRVYERLCEDDIDRELLRKSGIEVDEDEIEIPTASRVCAECHHINGPTSDRCGKCGYPLTEEGLAQHMEAKSAIEELPEYKALIRELEQKYLGLKNGEKIGVSRGLGEN